MKYDVKKQAEKLIHAFESKDIEKVGELFAENILFEDVPMGSYQGKESAVNKVTSFFGMVESVKWDVQRIACQDNLVFVERINHIVLNGKEITLPMVMILEFNEQGLLSLFRDYFDKQTFENQLK